MISSNQKTQVFDTHELQNCNFISWKLTTISIIPKFKVFFFLNILFIALYLGLIVGDKHVYQTPSPHAIISIH